MRDALDPGHWTNGWECDHPHPDAIAMDALDTENKQLRAEVERLRNVVLDYQARCNPYVSLATQREADQLRAEVERLNEAQRWVPVDERLPETRDPVLTLWVSGMQSVKQYDEQHGWNTGAQVTHWMLLPELPKKEVQG
jgi:hypothetical protein